MSIEEAKDKVVKKFKENFDKNQLTYDEKTFLYVMNHLIDSSDDTSYFEIENLDINKIIEPVKPISNINSPNININSNLAQVQDITTNIINDVINLCNESREEKENCLNNIFVPTPEKTEKSKKFKEKKIKKSKAENQEKISYEASQDKNSVTGGPKKAIISKRFYIKQ
jgi:hypothetical protein